MTQQEKKFVKLRLLCSVKSEKAKLLSSRIPDQNELQMQKRGKAEARDDGPIVVDCLSMSTRKEHHAVLGVLGIIGVVSEHGIL